MIRAGACLLAALLAAPAAANDSMAELRAGGLVFVKSPSVAMRSEDLYVSAKEVRVDYVFINEGTADERSIVAFPMPDMDGNPWIPISIPDDASANFLDFTVTVDGASVEPKLQQRAFSAGIDVTGEIEAAGVPLIPFGEATRAAVAKLPDATKVEWVRRGLLVIDTYDDDGTGMKDYYEPYWSLKTTYWWETTFPAGREVRVQHRYKPGIGATAGVTFLDEDGFLDEKKPGGPNRRDYAARFCMDDGFLRAVGKSIPPDQPYGTPFYEQRLAYVLTTGRNWSGSIRRFHLTVDKGSPGNLVSFCGQGVTKTGPTTFELTATDFYPERDLEVLILTKADAR